MINADGWRRGWGWDLENLGSTSALEGGRLQSLGELALPASKGEKKLGGDWHRLDRYYALRSLRL